MARFTPPNPDWKQLAITLTIIAIVLGVGMTTMQTATSNLQTAGVEHFDDFCEDIWGESAYTYNAQTIGPHGGLHCTANFAPAGTIHYSQLPHEEYQAYINGEASAWEVVRNLEPMPSTGPLGVAPKWVWSVTAIALVLLVAFTALIVGPQYMPRP